MSFAVLKTREALILLGKIYDNEFVFAHYVTSCVSGVKSVLWGKNWGKSWGIKLSTQCCGGIECFLHVTEYIEIFLTYSNGIKGELFFVFGKFEICS